MLVRSVGARATAGWSEKRLWPIETNVPPGAMSKLPPTGLEKMLLIAVTAAEVRDAAAAVAAAGRVAAEGGVGDGQRAVSVVDAAAAEGRVAAEGGVGDRQRAPVVDAAAVEGRVATEGGVGDRQRAVKLVMPPPIPLAELPLRVELVTVSVPSRLSMPPPPLYSRRVAAEGGVGDRQRAGVLDAAAVVLAELPLRVELMSVTVPEL